MFDGDKMFPLQTEYSKASLCISHAVIIDKTQIRNNRVSLKPNKVIFKLY